MNKQFESDLKPIIKEIGDALLPIAADRMGFPLKILKKRMRIRLRRTNYSSEINADINNSASIINVNEALMIFYHKMLKVFAATLKVGIIKNGIKGKITISPDRVASVFDKLAQAYLEGRILTQKGFSLWDLEEGQQTVTHRLVNGCECFAVAHELGHAIIINSKNEVNEYIKAERIIREFLSSINELAEKQKSKLIKPWTNEICADLIGLNLSLAQPKRLYKDWENYQDWLFAGAEINRMLDWMLNAFEFRLNGESEYFFSFTHPPDFLRLQALRSCLGTDFSITGFDIGSNFFYFASGILDHIFKGKPFPIYFKKS